MKTQCLKGRILAATRGETHPGKQQEPIKGTSAAGATLSQRGNLREKLTSHPSFSLLTTTASGGRNSPLVYLVGSTPLAKPPSTSTP